MLRRNVLAFALFFSSFSPFALSQGSLLFNWAHSWGGAGTDAGSAVATDSTGDVYVAGSTTSFGAGGEDALLMKYDAGGSLLWTRTWGGASTENTNAVAVGPDGGIYVTGGTNSFGAGWYDVFLLKFDSSGNLLWQRTWGGASYDAGHDIGFDNAGNILVAAESYSYVPSGDSAAAVLKFTPSGDLLWSRVWASGLPVVTGPVYDGGYSLDIDGNGNILLSGVTWDYNSSPNHNSIFVVKFDSSGNLLWNRGWAGPGEDEAWGAKTVRADSTGNVYVAGRTAPSPCAGTNWGTCRFDVLLLKLDANGNYVSSRTWDSGTGYNTAESFTFDTSGNLVVAGAKDEFGASAAALLLQYDPTGNLLLSQTWSGAPGSNGSAVTLGSAGNIILAGSALNNIGSWQNASGASGTENGTLRTQASHVAWPAVALGSPSGTTTDPSGVVDLGGGGMDVLTSSFSFGVSPVIPQPPAPQTGSGPATSSTSQQGSVAEPVSTGSGNYHYEHADFTVPARGLPLTFERYYNSIDSFSGPLGVSWNHAYNVLLGETAAGVATIRWGDGHGETYTLTGGVYVPQAGVFNSLVANPDSTFTLTLKNQTQYVFSSAGKLIEIQDKNGNAVDLTYDGSGNLTTIAAAGGRSLTLAYDTQGRIVSVTDPISRTETYSYDGANNLASTTDPLGGVSTYAYDANHHVTQITLPNGNTLLKNACDTQGRVVSQTNGNGFTWQFAYNTLGSGQTTITDARGAVTVHTYDTSLRIVSILDALGHITSYAYDSSNNRTSVTNQNGNTTSFAYDANGNLLGVTDPLANKTTFTYDASNNLVTAANPKGKTTAFSYDAHSNLTGIQDALGDKTTLTYDSSGELTGRTDAKGNTTSFSYGGAGDLTGITDALGKATTLAYDGDGRLVSVTNPNSHTATSTYDTLGRLTKVTDPLGNQTVFVYDAVGNLLSVTDANGHATSYAYDADNNLSTVTDALGRVTKYSYDQDNNRVKFTNAKGNATNYQYDALNRLIGTADPLSFATAYSYDPVGNVLAVTDAKGQTNRFAYDALNRLLSITYADSKNVAYSYDADGNRTSMTDWTGMTSYQYDALDRLASVAFPGSKTVAYSYDANGRRVSLTYPDGKVVQYGYDADERLSTATDWLSHVAQYTYDPAGNLLKTQYPNKANIGFTYDAANRLTSVVNNTVGVPPLAFNYTLDPVGNRTVVTEAGIPTNYGYDALNELTSAQLWLLKTTWTYDPVGNRLSQASPLGVTNYAYDASDRLLKAGTRTFIYDADGNQISVTDAFTHFKRTYAFNAANRLISVDGGLTDSFVYDGDGNRVSQSAGGSTQSYVNDVAATLPVVLQDTYNVGSPTSYVYGLNLIESLQGRDDDFYQYDGLGSVIQLTNSAGFPELSYFYDAWGNSILPSPPTNPFRFTGQTLDSTTGLYYLRARYYDPTLGRFLSRDPLLENPSYLRSTSPYIYGLNSPTRFGDPTGLLTEAIGFSASAVFGGGGSGSLMVVFDDKGNRGLIWSYGYALGVGVGINATLAITNSDSIYGLASNPNGGMSVGQSITIAPPVSVQGRLLLSSGQPSGVAVGAGLGVSAIPQSATLTWSNLSDVNALWLELLFPAQPPIPWSAAQAILNAANVQTSSSTSQCPSQ